MKKIKISKMIILMLVTAIALSGFSTEAFAAERINIKSCQITVYNAAESTMPEVDVSYQNQKLTSSKDYLCIKECDGIVKVVGIGLYKGQAIKAYTVIKSRKSIGDCEIDVSTSKDGTVTVSVKDDNTALKRNTDYVYTKENNSLRIRGIGKYYGQVIRKLDQSEEKPSSLPNISVTTTSVDNTVEAMKAFAKKYADDNSYKYRKWSESNKYTHMCPLHHPESNKYATKGWNCRGYIAAICKHGGKISSVTCSCAGFGLLGKNYSYYTMAHWISSNGSEWKRIINGGSNLKKSQLKDGDVIFYFNGSSKSMYHVAMVYDASKGTIADSTSGKGITIRTPKSYGLVAFRTTHKLKATKDVPLTETDTRTSEVKKWNAFLKYYKQQENLQETGFKTLTKAFQKANKLKETGTVDANTISKAKIYLSKKAA